MRRLLAPLIALTVLVAVAGCASGGQASQPASAGSGAFPVTVRSALGTATIDAAPKRVVTLGWGSNDAALALGVVPVGMSAQVTAGRGITPWAKDAIRKLKGTTPAVFDADAGTIPFEKIAALRPDVILAVYSGITAEQYATLSKIAPVVGYPDKPWSTTWQDQLATVGEALGKKDEAAALEKRVNAEVAAAKRGHPEFRGRTAVFGSGTTAGSYNFYLADDPRMTLLGELGFTVSRAATDTFEHGADSPTFATTVSLEQVSKLRADVLVAWYLSDQTRNAIEQTEVFRGLGPVRDKAYVPVTDPSLLFATSAPNVLSIPWMLDEYVPLLSTAAKNAAQAR